MVPLIWICDDDDNSKIILNQVPANLQEVALLKLNINKNKQIANYEKEKVAQTEITNLENYLILAIYENDSQFFEGYIMGIYALLGFVFIRFFVFPGV